MELGLPNGYHRSSCAFMGELVVFLTGCALLIAHSECEAVAICAR